VPALCNRYLAQRRSPGEAPGPAPVHSPGEGSERRPPLLPLPGKLETGDLLLILILLLAWLENEDEELLILLSALVVLSL
jgi:hypothetical protein